ncbi:MAG TPA: response regulator [Burkholderiales bacterium]|nr:response regulator [Burkholderiales bacterium]
MSESIKVLLIEDTAEDAELLIRDMRKDGLDIVPRQVATRRELAEALDTFVPDVILSDFSLPGFGGMDALTMVKERQLDTPFIFVSGTIGEETAIEALKQGAIDYVLKDKRGRLVPSIQRALHECEERRARRKAEQEAEEALRRAHAELERRVEERTEALGKAVDALHAEIAERQRAEEELKLHRNHLEELIRERTAELVVAKERAEVANRAKSAFLASMSHELRTPLNGVLGYAQILKRDKSLNDRQRSGLNTIQQSGEHLLMLITDILDLSKIESGKLELLPRMIDLPIFLQTVVEVMRVKAEEKSLLFVYECEGKLPPWIQVDEKRLRQVLLNLLGNAVKFTSRGQVGLVVKSVPDGDAAIRLRFEAFDTGIGISEEQRAILFRPFERDSSPQQRFGGAGLGLAISRQLVRMMGGDIGVDSELGAGSRFWFEVSASTGTDAPAVAPIEPLVSGYEGRRRKVLVVDDVVGNRLMLVEMLSPLGFEIVEAMDGQEGVKQAEAIRPDLILMDRMMPVMDGLEATRRIRQLPDLRATPIFLISASTTQEDRNESLAAGATAFVAKPIHENTLMREIERHLTLNWRYEVANAEQSPAARASGGPLVTPPKGEMQILYKFALEGNMKEVRKWAIRIAALDEQYQPFADKLTQLAQGFQSEEILKLVEGRLDERAI